MIVKRQLDPKLEWFRGLRFGMMIHFGLYALLGRHEWVMYRENIPRENYRELMKRFNPHKFDADEWVDTALKGGARYMTVTAKHHDGFCLWDSKETDYTITHTPFGRDLIGELIDACHRGGLRICLFYSQPDWDHPCFVHRKGHWKELQYTRSDDTPDWDEYVRYYHAQVEELCTQYGRIDGIWFDGSHRPERDWRGREIYEKIKRHQPHAVVNDRAGYGDFFTPERRLSGEAAADGYMVETIQSIDTWSWGWSRNTPLFSSPMLIQSLVTMASVGGNFALNLGPKPDGTLPARQVERWLEVGAWLKSYGNAIYDSEGCCHAHESGTRLYTRKGKTAYLHLLDWPDRDRIVLNRLKLKPTSARLLGSQRKLTVDEDGGSIALQGLPSLPPDPSANVIAMDFPRGDMFKSPHRKPPARVFDMGDSTRLVLPFEEATCRGYGFKGQPLVAAVRDRHQDEETMWKSPDQSASWKVGVPRRTRCRVSVEMACQSLYAGSTFVVKVGKARLEGVVPATKDFKTYKRVDLGVVTLPKGTTTLTMRSVKQNYGYVFADVRRVVLKQV